MLKYKFPVMPELSKKGYSARRLRNERLLAESTMTKLRHAAPISWDNIDTICRLLQCQPGELLRWVPDDTNTNTNTKSDNNSDVSSNNT